MEATLGRASARPRRSVDWTAPFSIAMVVLLAVLVLMPLFWLLLTSFRDAEKAFTLEHYRHLFVDPAFIKPLVTTLWTSAAVGAICVATAAPMAWLVARTDLPGKRFLRTLILASFVTPPFLGAFAWVLLGGPNAGLINQWYYALLGVKPFEATSLDQHFFCVGHGLRHGPVHVSVRLHLRRQQPGHDSERTRGGFLDPGCPGLAHCFAHHPAAGHAGTARGVPGRLSAVDDALRNARDPGASGGRRYDDHQDLEPVPVSRRSSDSRPQLRCRCC